MRRPPLTPTLLATGLLAILLTACGKKPDGTPYGVDPARLPEGRRKVQTTTSIYKQDVPKGAEMNAVTSGARVGQPAAAPLPGAPAR
ncbi:hypothetical protein [Hymenobacter bucti]|uniref:Lipoprotein n=1 Tax=Hymenobacter bucti TaxID=1844114 RepID=A0ABW4QSJ3_9BACT